MMFWTRQELREEIENLKSENLLIREESDRHYQLWIDEKAEVEQLKKLAIPLGYNISEYIRMANSETLEFDNGDIFADKTLPERIKYIVDSHARLKAEVERLTKAGDAMEVTLQADFNGCPYEPTIVREAMIYWQKAKGVQS